MRNSRTEHRSARTRRQSVAGDQKLVPFHWEGVSYVLDPDRNKVYRNWMAVETNKGVAVLGAYRQTAAIPA